LSVGNTKPNKTKTLFNLFRLNVTSCNLSQETDTKEGFYHSLVFTGQGRDSYTLFVGLYDLLQLYYIYNYLN